MRATPFTDAFAMLHVAVPCLWILLVDVDEERADGDGAEIARIPRGVVCVSAASH